MKHKRILSVLMSLVMASAVSAGCVTAAAEYDRPTEYYAEPDLGDVNGDYMFNVADVVWFNNYLLGKQDHIIYECADINQDGNINVFDLILLRRLFSERAPLGQLYPIEDLCDGIKPGKVRGAAIDEEFVLAQTGFGLDMLKRMDCEENALISPYSIMEALAMTANGAKGKTLSEMEEAMGGISVARLNEYLYTQRTGQPDEEKCRLLTANSIWARNDESRIKVNKDFLQTVMDCYDAEFYVADFDDQRTVDAVNNWVSRHTDKMIEKLLDDIDGETVMELINAVTFDAKWEHQYYAHDVERGADFTAADGSRQKADMLCSTEHTYLEDENAKGIMKYYSGGRYAFAALLPDEGVSLSDYVSGLTAERLNSILSNAERTEVTSKIPKFSYDYDISLSENILQDMGMVTPFIDGAADFSGLNDTDKQLHISDVFHKTFITLDEEGTRAAAVTEVALATNCINIIEKEVILDRPFLYCIVDTESNIPVFIGTLTSLD